jgi:3-hydroxyacyl-[acyl-carrier-protein] dehydratase
MGNATSLIYDTSIIQEILPHRSPFLFVDRVLRLEPQHKILAEKDILKDEWFFKGHFPGNPIVPGVIVTESLAQASGLLLGLSWKKEGMPETQMHPPSYFLANVNIKFAAPARPEETIRLASTLQKGYGKIFLFEVQANVAENLVAKGTLMLAQQE